MNWAIKQYLQDSMLSLEEFQAQNMQMNSDNGTGPGISFQA